MVALLIALAGVSFSCLMALALRGARSGSPHRRGQRIPLEHEAPLA